jgi:hypothetical protein
MTQQAVDLVNGEFVILDEGELLWRQVPPGFLHDGQVGSDAFCPTAKDKGKLSTRRSSLMSAEEAYRDHVDRLGYQSVGAVSVSVKELNDQGIRAIDDSALPTSPPGHAYGDFRGLGSNRARTIARKLKVAALKRGFSFRPEDG